MVLFFSLNLHKHKIMARLSKADWLQEGFKILQEFAQNKLRILYLCERLRVTRGSFYHHFSSIEDYISSLMQQWEKENTIALIQASEQAATPAQKMEILNELVAKIDQSIEAAIRSWGFYNEVVGSHLKKVDEQRIGYLQGLFEKMGFSTQEALYRAKIDYAVLVGIQQLFPNINAKELEILYETYSKNLNENGK